MDKNANFNKVKNIFNIIKVFLALTLLKCILIILNFIKGFLWKIIYQNGQAA